MTKKEAYVLTEDVSEGVRRVVLNRPDKRNALSNSLRKELFSSLAVSYTHLTLPTKRIV